MTEICGGGPATQKSIEEHIQVHNFIRSYQTRGFLVADLDPLGIVRSKPIKTKSGMQLKANEMVLMHNKDFLKGKLAYDYVLKKYKDCFIKTENVNLDKKFLLPQTTYIGGDEKRLSFR